jgi:membrane associated rhomboid family serine protease
MRPEWGDPPAAGGGGGFGLAFPALTSVTRALLWANGVTFLVLFLLVRIPGGVGEWLYEMLALQPAQWWNWFPLVPVWQLATYGFVHSLGDIFHLLFNLLALYFFGTMVEGAVGGRRFGLTYAVALLLGGLAQLAMGLVQIATETPVPGTLGASGAVMCMIVAAAVMQPNMRVIFILFPLRLRTLAIILVGIDVFRMLSGGSNVAWLVHLTGAAYGFLAVRRRWIWADPMAGWAQRREVREAERAQDESRRVDQLLARIHEHGLQSLSAREKAFLKRVSARGR